MLNSINKLKTKFIAVLICSFYFTTHIALGQLSESNLWTERQNRIALLSTSPSNPQVQNLLDKLPSLAPNTSLQNRAKLNFPSRNNFSALTEALPMGKINIQDSFISSTQKKSPVLIIQDVHMNNEAQKNIIATLQNLNEQNKLSLIGVEGAFSKFNFDRIRSIPDTKILKDLSEAYLNKNYLAAPSYVGITSEKNFTPIIGVDNLEKYKENVKALQDSLKIKNSRLKAISKMQIEIETQKKLVYSQPLAEYDLVENQFQNNELSFSDFLSKLLSFKNTDDLNIHQFVEASQLERTLDFARIENERRIVLEKLTKALSEEEISGLIKNGIAFRTGEISFGYFYSQMKSLCETHAVNLNKTPEFQKYIQYVLLCDRIRASNLFAGIQSLKTAIINDRAKSEEEKKLVRESEFIGLAKKISSLELTSDEWAQYKNLVPLITLRSQLNLTSAEKFYELADQRSHLITERVALEKMNKPIALICGGFHTEEISALLKKKDISFLIVSPKITKTEGLTGNDYLSIFEKEKTPIDRLFSGEKLFINPPHLAVGTTDLPEAASKTRSFIADGLARVGASTPWATVSRKSNNKLTVESTGEGIPPSNVDLSQEPGDDISPASTLSFFASSNFYTKKISWWAESVGFIGGILSIGGIIFGKHAVFLFINSLYPFSPSFSVTASIVFLTICAISIPSFILLHYIVDLFVYKVTKKFQKRNFHSLLNGSIKIFSVPAVSVLMIFSIYQLFINIISGGHSSNHINDVEMYSKAAFFVLLFTYIKATEHRIWNEAHLNPVDKLSFNINNLENIEASLQSLLENPSLNNKTVKELKPFSEGTFFNWENSQHVDLLKGALKAGEDSSINDAVHVFFTFMKASQKGGFLLPKNKSIINLFFKDIHPYLRTSEVEVFDIVSELSSKGLIDFEIKANRDFVLEIIKKSGTKTISALNSLKNLFQQRGILLDRKNREFILKIADLTGEGTGPVLDIYSHHLIFRPDLFQDKERQDSQSIHLANAVELSKFIEQFSRLNEERYLSFKGALSVLEEGILQLTAFNDRKFILMSAKESKKSVGYTLYELGQLKGMALVNFESNPERKFVEEIILLSKESSHWSLAALNKLLTEEKLSLSNETEKQEFLLWVKNVAAGVNTGSFKGIELPPLFIQKSYPASMLKILMSPTFLEKTRVLNSVEKVSTGKAVWDFMMILKIPFYEENIESITKLALRNRAYDPLFIPIKKFSTPDREMEFQSLINETQLKNFSIHIGDKKISLFRFFELKKINRERYQTFFRFGFPTPDELKTRKLEYPFDNKTTSEQIAHWTALQSQNPDAITMTLGIIFQVLYPTEDDFEGSLRKGFDEWKGKEILNIGAGHRLFLRKALLKTGFKEKNLFDIDIDIPSSELNDQVRIATVESLPQEFTNTKDIVIAGALFNEEVVDGTVYGKPIDLALAVNNIHRVLKKGGKLIMTVGASDWPDHMLYYFVQAFGMPTDPKILRMHRSGVYIFEKTSDSYASENTRKAATIPLLVKMAELWPSSKSKKAKGFYTLRQIVRIETTLFQILPSIGLLLTQGSHYSLATTILTASSTSVLFTLLHSKFFGKVWLEKTYGLSPSPRKASIISFVQFSLIALSSTLPNDSIRNILISILVIISSAEFITTRFHQYLNNENSRILIDSAISEKLIPQLTQEGSEISKKEILIQLITESPLSLSLGSFDPRRGLSTKQTLNLLGMIERNLTKAGANSRGPNEMKEPSKEIVEAIQLLRVEKDRSLYIGKASMIPLIDSEITSNVIHLSVIDQNDINKAKAQADERINQLLSDRTSRMPLYVSLLVPTQEIKDLITAHLAWRTNIHVSIITQEETGTLPQFMDGSEKSFGLKGVGFRFFIPKGVTLPTDFIPENFNDPRVRIFMILSESISATVMEIGSDHFQNLKELAELRDSQA